jgi:RNA polymerase sigma-70 factor (ECF subfamily)
MDEATRLLVAARSGDRRALSLWVRAGQAEVWRLCAALVDIGEADDLTQETFLRAYRALPRFRGESSARTWLLSIARRVCADAIRARRRQRRLLSRLAEPDGIPMSDGVEVEDLLARLDPDRRAAFVLTQFLGLSYSEAAEVCGCAVGTIRSRVARARVELVSLFDTGESAIS